MPAIILIAFPELQIVFAVKYDEAGVGNPLLFHNLLSLFIKQSKNNEICRLKLFSVSDPTLHFYFIWHINMYRRSFISNKVQQLARLPVPDGKCAQQNFIIFYQSLAHLKF